MDKRIKDFIASSHIFSLGVRDEDGGVYTANCFYVFEEEEGVLIFKSDGKSRHIELAKKNPQVAIGIFENTKNLQEIKGVQIKAIFKESEKMHQQSYYKAYPFARMISGKIYILKLMWVKYTDNKLLLPRKIEYHRLGSKNV